RGDLPRVQQRHGAECVRCVHGPGWLAATVGGGARAGRVGVGWVAHLAWIDTPTTRPRQPEPPYRLLRPDSVCRHGSLTDSRGDLEHDDRCVVGHAAFGRALSDGVEPAAVDSLALDIGLQLIGAPLCERLAG